MNQERTSDIFCIKDIWTWFDENNKFLNMSNNHEYTMKLLKLTFFAVEFYKAYTKESLVKETFEAWKEGPVSNNAYAQIRQEDRSDDMEKFNYYPKVVEILNKINDIFGIYSANALSECTHLLDSWKHYYQEDENGDPIKHIAIPERDLEEEFKVLIENLDYFYRFNSDKESACIIGDKTVIYNKKNEYDFEFHYDEIYNHISDPQKFNGENLIFLDFDGGEVHYEL